MSKNLKAESVKVGKGDNKDGVSITGPDGANGTDGKVGITGKDGKDAVSMSGKDGIGHIGLMVRMVVVLISLLKKATLILKVTQSLVLSTKNEMVRPTKWQPKMTV